MEPRSTLRRVVLKEDGETVQVDLEVLRRDFEEWKGVIATIYAIESMTTPTRSEFDRIPSKYLAIAQTIGADRVSRDQEQQENLFRFFGGTS